MSDRVIYIIGALRNEMVPKVANNLRKQNPDWEVFDSWYSPGPNADDYLRDYCKGKGLSFKETLKDWAATHIFEFDKKHLTRSTDVILVMPAGKSGHLELGWAAGLGKRSYVFFDEEPERVDIMYQFATEIFFDFNEMVDELKKYDPVKTSKKSDTWGEYFNGMKRTPNAPYTSIQRAPKDGNPNSPCECPLCLVEEKLERDYAELDAKQIRLDAKQIRNQIADFNSKHTRNNELLKVTEGLNGVK